MTSLTPASAGITNVPFFAICMVVSRVLADPQVQAAWRDAGVDGVAAVRASRRAFTSVAKAGNVTAESWKRNRGAR